MKGGFNMIELWKTLYFKGKKLHYEVSNSGKIRNTKTGKNLNPSLNTMGYYRVYINLPTMKNRKSFYIHRLVAWLFLDHTGIDVRKMHVNHIDGNPKNNCVTNLEWVSPRENTLHAWRIGLCKPGENSGHHVYNNEIIERVCKLLEEDKLSIRKISEITGVSISMISHIRNGKNWKHISSHFKIRKNKANKDFSKYYDEIDKYVENGYGKQEIFKLLPDIKDEVGEKRFAYLINNRQRHKRLYNK